MYLLILWKERSSVIMHQNICCHLFLVFFQLEWWQLIVVYFDQCGDLLSTGVSCELSTPEKALDEGSRWTEVSDEY